MMKSTLVALAAALLLPLTACEKTAAPHADSAAAASESGKTVDVSGLILSAYAMRAALGNNPNTAAYVSIANHGEAEDRLVSAACACATTASLHTMKMNGAVMEMADAPDGFVIKPGETLTFAPGGNHIMLEGLTARPHEGETVDVTLTFEKAGAVTLPMPVSNTPLAATGTSGQMDHGDMKM